MRKLFEYRHIIWDWNGTLLDDVWLCTEIVNGLLSARGKATLSQEHYREVFDFPVKDYYRTAGFDFTHESFEEVGGEFIEEYNRRVRECKLHAGVPELLDYFQKHNITQSVLSAREQIFLKREVAHFDLERYLIDIVGLDNYYAHSKQELAADWMKSSCLARQAVLLIGDTTHDYEVAESLGMDCVLVASGHQTMEKLQRCAAVVVATLSDLRSGHA